MNIPTADEIQYLDTIGSHAKQTECAAGMTDHDMHVDADIKRLQLLRQYLTASTLRNTWGDVDATAVTDHANTICTEITDRLPFAFCETRPPRCLTHQQK